MNATEKQRSILEPTIAVDSLLSLAESFPDGPMRKVNKRLAEGIVNSPVENGPEFINSVIRGAGIGVNNHKQAAHDIPLICHLVNCHATMIFAVYDPAIRQTRPLAFQARKAVDELFKLKNLLHEQAKKEHPEADWLQQYEAEYTGTVWPPRITDKEEVAA